MRRAATILKKNTDLYHSCKLHTQ